MLGVAAADYGPTPHHSDNERAGHKDRADHIHKDATDLSSIHYDRIFFSLTNVSTILKVSIYIHE